MSRAITHFAVGAAAITLIVSVFSPQYRYKATLIMCSGTWALVPDVYRFLPVFADRFGRLHDHPIANVFWFHHLFDQLDPTDSPAVAATALVIWFVMTVVVEVGWDLWRRPTRSISENRFR